MEKEFVPYELAVKLKELGFNEPCFGFYLEDCTWTPASYSKKGTVYPSNSDLLPEWSAAPLYQQAFRWFREKHNINHSIIFHETTFSNDYQYLVLSNENEFVEVGYTTYEEAELACLQKLIEIVKSK